MKLRKEDALFLSLIAVALLWTYRHAGSIPFLYSEVPGIRDNPLVRDGKAFISQLITWRGILQRPLSVLTFRLNWLISETNVASYHWTNGLIHFFNVIIFYILAKKWVRLPRVATAFFALHPLASACISQVFGRPYSLVCFLMLLSLERVSRNNKNITILILLYISMFLTKQSFVFFPALLLWIEWSRQEWTIQNVKKYFSIKTTLYFIVTAGIALAFIFKYAAPLSRTAPIGVFEALYSQLGNVSNLVCFYLLPFQLSYLHDLPFYMSALNLNVLFGFIVAVSFIFYVCWFHRSKHGFLFGALLITLLPTNSFFPKNEVIREWRLYPSLIFFCLWLSEILALSYDRIKDRWTKKSLYYFRWTGVVLGVCYLTLFSITINQQNIFYKSTRSMWESVLKRYPQSADAANNIAVIYFQEQQFNSALKYFQLAEELGPKVYLYAENTGHAYRALGLINKAEKQSQKSASLMQKFGPMRMNLIEVQ